jgi:Cu/Ag efflux pump CusA
MFPRQLVRLRDVHLPLAREKVEYQFASYGAGADMLVEGIRDGAVLGVRPKAMTVAVIIAGLLPIFTGSGSGSEVMSRIAAPMVGGMLTAPVLSMLVIPAAYLLMRRAMTGRAEELFW